MSDTTKKCPHCEQEIPPDPITEESIAATVDLVETMESVAKVMSISITQAFEMQLRVGMRMQERERDPEGLMRRLMSGRLQ